MLRTTRAAFLGMVSVVGCVASDPLDSQPGELLLISADGLRYDFVDRVPTPALDRLAAAGVHAPLVPSFPSKTFPNHYTIVTGLYPAQHGIVANNMYDPVFDARFSLSDREAVGDGRWWGGEPIWVTAEKHGRRAASFFWPGSEAPVGGVRPTWWRLYDIDIPYDDRVDQVLAWFDLPADERPSLVTTYFEGIDTAGHDFGPDAVEVDSAVTAVDRAIGRLLDGLAARDLLDRVNVIVVSDHGVAATSRDRVIFLDDYLDTDRVDIVDWSPVLQIRPAPGQTEAIYDALVGRHPHLAVYRREDVPDVLHYRDHRRIQPIVAIADPGWGIATRAALARSPALYRGGDHGYDHRDPSMLAFFVASGPALAEAVTAPAFGNVHLYELMARILGVPAAPNAGSPDSTVHLLRRSARN